jgi:OHCU decarboxylase
MSSGPSPTSLPTIGQLNALPPERFAPALSPLFEAARPLAEALYEGRPYDSYGQLLDRAELILEALPLSQKIEVINAHPRIGAPPAALRRSSPTSYREQGYEGESVAERDELQSVNRRLAELNRSYEARHGFRFVVFVNRRPRSEIVTVLESRLGRSREQELAAALHELLAIARDRLRTLSAPV